MEDLWLKLMDRVFVGQFNIPVHRIRFLLSIVIVPFVKSYQVQLSERLLLSRKQISVYRVIV